jgi:UDP-N-acetylglucosamine 2-epimerase (non-hydrolysing)/GDP/UDP-N,N'-diacetylbacillosamine 2-epimerase (hydrolysing)
MKRKITVTTGSRSEYGILRPVLQQISKSKKLELFLIVAGMHLSKKHGMTINEIRNDGFNISASVNMMPSRDSNYSMSIALGKGIIKFSKIFQKIRPDINLILGDRDEMLASALAAYHMNILNAHIHGGDKSKAGIDEYNRHAITKISNIHYAATQKSKERIIKMGENPKNVFLTGSPSIDEISLNKITDRNTLEKKYGINFLGHEILLLQHPVTSESDLSKIQIINTLKAIIKLNKPTIAIAPNSDVGNSQIFKQLKLFSQKYPFITLFSTIPRNDYLGMLKYCGVLVGNSSSGMIEASYFNTPVVNIGIRQKDRERGKNVLDVQDYNINKIFIYITKALKMKKHINFKNCKIYGNGNASYKIVRNLEKIILNKQLIQKQIYY